MRTGELSQRYLGLFIGTVLDIDDPEGLGRVRIRTDQIADTSDNPIWASVARPLAGDGVTVYFTPRVGDQVVVGYLAGDSREPLVMGYAHSIARRPPDSVGPRAHGIVTGVGSVVFDEEGGRVVVRFTGTPESSVELGPAGVVITGPTVSINAPAIALNGAVSVGSLSFSPSSGGPAEMTTPGELKITTGGGQLCVNGHAVVLAPFLLHVHKVGAATTEPPIPIPESSTVCTP